MFHLTDLGARSKLALSLFLAVCLVRPVTTVVGAVTDQSSVNALHVATPEPLLRIRTGSREHASISRLICAVCTIRHRVTDRAPEDAFVICTREPVWLADPVFAKIRVLVTAVLAVFLAVTLPLGGDTLFSS